MQSSRGWKGGGEEGLCDDAGAAPTYGMFQVFLVAVATGVLLRCHIYICVRWIDPIKCSC